MKFFVFLFFLTAPLFAQACLESELTTASYPLNCDTLTINSNLNLTHISTAIIINVSGDVTINGQITVSGQHGTLLAGGGIGGLGGPGGFAGGGYDDSFYEPLPGMDFPHGGKPGNKDIVNCGDGGAGAGLVTAGQNGKPCIGATTPPSEGGEALPDLTNIESSLSGSHGGGAGGVVNDNTVATGGGGGGAIHIISSGKITLSTTAIINANGGNGATSINENGAGGGGSGGVIILEASTLDLEGKLFVRGGKGGQAPDGGHGGDGSSGLIRLKDSNGTVDYFNEKDFTKGKTPDPIRKELKLNSGISCGTIANNDDQNGGNLFLQVLLPLLILVAISHFKKKSQDPV